MSVQYGEFINKCVPNPVKKDIFEGKIQEAHKDFLPQ